MRPHRTEGKTARGTPGASAVVQCGTRAEIRRRIVQGCLGEQVDVEVVIRDQIPRSRTGKRQAVVSEAT